MIFIQRKKLRKKQILHYDFAGILNPRAEDRFICFEVVGEKKRPENCRIRCDSEHEAEKWVAAIERARSRLDHFEHRPDRLQVQIVRSCLGFLRLARPELSTAAVREVTRGMARSLQLSEEVAARAIAELLPGKDLAERDPDPIQASSEAGD